jgi:hypothetical protein
MLTDELLGYIFDGQSSHLLAQPMAAWLASSRRFTDFVNTFRDKIRKKLRTVRDTEGLLDLRLELETAYLLLQERSLNLIYEPQRSEKLRRPDFAVTFTTSLTFMLEVTRLQASQKSTSTETVDAIPANSSMGERLADAICSKLGQLLPQHSNILLLGVEATPITHDELHTAMLRVQQRVEGNNPGFLRRYQFRDRAHFFQHFHRLSEVLVRVPVLQTAEPVIVWVNPQGKHPLPARVRTALHRSHTI